MNTITPELISAHGLTDAEFGHACKLIGRTPNLVELGILSALWSEHCSYKSSKRWLRKFSTTAPWVICGPGENAGVVDIGDGLVVIFKMESHNHPSFIEPYQGAATGVGGILRDVFTMGARPVANLNALWFGSPEHSKTRHLVDGVVAGIGGYGNCVGVPTVGGSCGFDPAYNGNILVNAMAVGVAEKNRVFYSAASGIGNPVVYVGAKTGRDGIHGATMASAEFDETREARRPTVQVGDPFTEKLLIEACLELMATDAIVAIQDMGAAGLTSSACEMASKGGVGITLDLDRIPQRESGMSAYDIMLSESQERMLMVIRPDKQAIARAVFEKWELDFVVIGTLTDSRHLLLHKGGEVAADIAIDPLVENAPEYNRPWSPAVPAPPFDAARLSAAEDYDRCLTHLLASPDLCGKRWIWEQYDHMVMADTAERPGADATVVRIHGSDRGLALTCDATPRYCLADPWLGGAQAVAEAARNLTAVGARPLAITDCLNFGNPERRDVMGAFVGCVEGMAAACRALDLPVVSGNVSFYNETNGRAINPTPTVGAVGLISDLDRKMTPGLRREHDALILIGETRGHLGASLFARDVLGAPLAAPPPVDFAVERRNADFVRDLINQGRIGACHDVSDGGVYVAVAEMALAGGVGASLSIPRESWNGHAWLFGEDQGRYVVAARAGDAGSVIEAAADAGVAARRVGDVGGDALTVSRTRPISLSELREAHEAWLPAYMGDASS